MGQRTPRCPAAVSLFAFLGELYVNVNLGPAYPRLLGTVRRRFACVFPFFLFLLPVAIIYSFFVFPPRCGTVYVTSRVGFSCCCVFRQLAFLVFGKREYQKRGLSTIGTLYILCVSLVRGRAPFETAGIGLSCSGGGWARWQPGGILGTGVVQYAGIGGWAGWRALVRDAEPSGRVPKFSEGHVLLWRSPTMFHSPDPISCAKSAVLFLTLTATVGPAQGTGFSVFSHPVSWVLQTALT